MGLKYIFKNLKKNILFIALIIIQLIIGFYSMYNSNILKSKITLEKNKINNDLNYGEVLQFQFNEFPTSNKDFDKIFDKTFNSIESINGINMFYALGAGEAIEQFNGFENFMVDNLEILDEESNKKYYINNMYYLNDTTIKKYNLKLLDGKNLNTSYFNIKNSNKVPIILGYNFKDYFKVGDIIKIGGEKTKEGLITGILANNQSIPGRIDFYGSQYENLNTYMLSIDSTLDIVSKNIMKETDNYFWFDKDLDNNKIQNIKNTITKKFADIGVKMNIIDMSEPITKQLKEYKSNLLLSNFVSIIVLIAVSFTFIISMLDSIIKRLKEFGIYILSGANITNIISIVYFEVLFIIVISFILFTGILFTLKDNINLNILIKIALIALIYSIITTIIPIIKIYKIKIKDIINGVEK